MSVTEVYKELGRLGVGEYNVIISSNIPLRLDGQPRSDQGSIRDPGVAVYFKLKGKDTVLACDKWAHVEDNIWSIAKHIEAMRGQARWGVGNLEKQFAGYTAIMSGREIRPWWEVLQVGETTGVNIVTDSFRSLAKKYHPDNGGSSEQMAELNEAFATFKKERGLA